MVNDRKAEELEAKGLYRRAATRWQEVMMICAEDDDREWVKQRRDTWRELLIRKIAEMPVIAGLGAIRSQ